MKKATDIVINAFYAAKKFSEVGVVGKFFIFIVCVVGRVEVGGKFFRVTSGQVTEV